MPFNLFRRRPKGPQISRDTSLKAKVHRNPAVTSQKRDDGSLTLLVPITLKRRYRMLAWLVGRMAREKLPETKHLELDAIGSRVWQLADGKRSVRQIVQIVGREYKQPRKEAEHSVTLFLKQLAQRRLVAIEIPLPAKAKRGKPKEGGG